MKSLTIKSKKTEINRLERFLEKIADEYNVYNNYYGNIVTAVTEAVENAIEYGNGGDENKNVYINFYSNSNGLCFQIKDEGVGHDIKKLINSEDISDPAFFMIQSLTDSWSYDKENNVLELCFSISSINYELSVCRKELLKSYLKTSTKVPKEMY